MKKVVTTCDNCGADNADDYARSRLTFKEVKLTTMLSDLTAEEQTGVETVDLCAQCLGQYRAILLRAGEEDRRLQIERLRTIANKRRGVAA